MVAVVLSLSVEFTCHPTEVIYLQGNAKDEEIILPENQNPTPAVRPD